MNFRTVIEDIEKLAKLVGGQYLRGLLQEMSPEVRLTPELNELVSEYAYRILDVVYGLDTLTEFDIAQINTKLASERYVEFGREDANKLVIVRNGHSAYEELLEIYEDIGNDYLIDMFSDLRHEYGFQYIRGVKELRDGSYAILVKRR